MSEIWTPNRLQEDVCVKCGAPLIYGSPSRLCTDCEKMVKRIQYQTIKHHKKKLDNPMRISRSKNQFVVVG